MNGALILSIIIVLAILFSGYRNGLFSSAATLLMLAVGIAIAAEFYQPVASVRWFKGLGDYGEPICLGVIFVVAYFLLQVTVNVLAPPVVHMRPAVSRFGGLGVSLLSGVALSGFLGLVVCMMPWTGVKGGQLTGESFIGTDLVTHGIARMSRGAGGKVFEVEPLYKRLREAERDRVCYQNLADILLRLTDVYSNVDSFTPLTETKLNNAIEKGTLLLVDGASGGKGVGAGAMACPSSGKPYVYNVKALNVRSIQYRSKGQVILAYDAEACHELGGKAARMVLVGWLAERGRLAGEVRLMPEEEFEADQPDGK